MAAKSLNPTAADLGEPVEGNRLVPGDAVVVQAQNARKSYEGSDAYVPYMMAESKGSNPILNSVIRSTFDTAAVAERKQDVRCLFTHDSSSDTVELNLNDLNHLPFNIRAVPLADVRALRGRQTLTLRGSGAPQSTLAR